MVSQSENRLKLKTLLPLAASPPHTKYRSVSLNHTEAWDTGLAENVSVRSNTCMVILDTADRLSGGESNSRCLEDEKSVYFCMCVV